tara:strand:- start:11316 stop:12557 length:1242 start_codon:yes stop_codon:yes gene_type:complete
MLTPAQQEIFNSPARMRTASCGRRFGKTYVSMMELVRHAAEMDKEVYYVAPSYRMAKSILWNPIKDMLKKLRWIDQTNEAELKIRLKSGSTIHLKGAENKDALRGVGLDFLVMDEYQDLDKELWTQVLRPTLSDRKGKALFIGTPKGVGSFSHEMYTMAKETEGWEAFSFKTIDGGQVDKAELEEAKRDLDERTFAQEYEATFNTYSGMVYYNFDRDEVVRECKNFNTQELYVGIDFNIDPMSLAIGVIQNNTLFFIDELNVMGSNTAEVCDELNRRYPRAIINIFPDPAGRQRKTSAGGKTDISILQNAGFKVFARQSHTLVRDRVNAVNSKLKNAKGLRQMFIDPNCKQIIKSLESLQYKPNTSIIDKNGQEHMADAVGYLVDFLWPIKRDVAKQSNPTRWNVSKPTIGVR